MLVFGCAHQGVRFDIAKRRTCLVLSAGGTRGVAELGALAAVREMHIPISCVVGTSVGALVGGLYAKAPDDDTTTRFHRLAAAYMDETEREAGVRGMTTGAVFAAVAAALSGGILVPATAALGGLLLGASTTTRADRSRLERVLRVELEGATIEGLTVPFATLHHQQVDQGLTLVVDRSGDLAEAIGASIANPFVFDDVDVAHATKLDPGSDRVAATPVEDACRLFPDANLLVVNISGKPALYGSGMQCPLLEVSIAVKAPTPEAFFQGGSEFDQVWEQGRTTTMAALKGTTISN
jgi:NTE family protein